MDFLLSFSFFLLSLSPLVSSHVTNHDDFLNCLSRRINDNTTPSKVIHTSKDSSFFSILDSSTQNQRLSVPTTPKPVSIITPVQATDVQTVIRCARVHGIHVRTRSNGHGYEGQSYVAYLRSITFDVDNRTGWVQTGATAGEFKTSENQAVQIINKWQYVADKVTDDLFIRATLERSNDNTVQASFSGLYLGPVNDLLVLMEVKFPILGLEAEDCTEMSWIESVLWFADYPKGESLGVLANRERSSLSFKGKDDFVQEPIPESAVRGLWRRLEAPEGSLAKIILTPLGGKMSEIAEHETPFPHREGNLYEIQYLAHWRGEEDKNKRETQKYLNWVDSVYGFMTPYVSKSPRGAYVNFMDIDLGMYLGKEKSKYEEGKSWGVKYFKNNFERLVRVKTSVDPTDFFCDEQSIPALLESLNDM
ncbi:LOW QUALITY PROTEIN: hypothetical protein HID58_076087 [Brassica napus]|uniref:FAD-binding PCMH-type domain-containing protein n=1 Tax=Brassica napus TaxID=3708 RepID=A0ABQ7YLH4_BRANA|nr:LOW QUALITY PROTEIN: hypothetical protein HID58_076087 [Brassica napus]